MWVLTIFIMLAGTTAEQHTYQGFTSQDECLKSAPVSGNNITNWGTITFPPGEANNVIVAYCAPDPATPVPVKCTQDKPCSADLNGDGTVDATDYSLFLQQYSPTGAK